MVYFRYENNFILIKNTDTIIFHQYDDYKCKYIKLNIFSGQLTAHYTLKKLLGT